MVALVTKEHCRLLVNQKRLRYHWWNLLQLLPKSLCTEHGLQGCFDVLHRISLLHLWRVTRQSRYVVQVSPSLARTLFTARRTNRKDVEMVFFTISYNVPGRGLSGKSAHASSDTPEADHILSFPAWSTRLPTPFPALMLLVVCPRGAHVIVFVGTGLPRSKAPLALPVGSITSKSMSTFLLTDTMSSLFCNICCSTSFLYFVIVWIWLVTATSSRLRDRAWTFYEGRVTECAYILVCSLFIHSCCSLYTLRCRRLRMHNQEWYRGTRARVT